jgi:predicted nuclease of predicted toxin-antitoxin system
VRLVADEDIDGPIVERLRAEGHEIIYIAESAPSLPDEEILSAASESGTLVITGDKDFGALVYREGQTHAGVLLLRLAGLDEQTKCGVVSNAIRAHGSEMAGAFSVLGKRALRIRRSQQRG